MNLHTANIFHSFQKTAYLDYIASRCLLNNKLFLQGCILASTAVEKYVKGYVISRLEDEKLIKRIHLDQLSKLRTWLVENDLDVLQFFDPNFLSIISKSYKLRYYDNLTEDVTVGFFPNQLLGELDYFVNTFETKIFLGLYQGDRLIMSDYKKSIQNDDSNLLLNNYILNGIIKKDHMEKYDKPFCIHVNKQSGSLGEIYLNENAEISIPYDNNLIAIFDVQS